MSDLRVYAVQDPTPVADGSWVNIRALNDGSAVTASFAQASILAGYGFHVTIGAFSTPITGGGDGTILDQDQPEGIISVPSGAAILPIRIHVQAQTPLLATDSDESEILIALDRTAAYDASGTVTTETIFNMRTDNPVASVVTARSAATANITNPTLGIELARSVIVGDVQGTAANALWTKNELLYEPKYPPVIVGPAAIYIYWGGTVATTGFAEVQWLELPSSKAQIFA